jgi:hypothetical protein
MSAKLMMRMTNMSAVSVIETLLFPEVCNTEGGKRF